MVIKSVGVFPSQTARNSVAVIAAMTECLKRNGISVNENDWNADTVLIWSVLWHGRMQANRPLYEHYRTKKRPVIVVDIGALRRGETWKVAVNNVTAEGYYGHTENLDRDRPKKLKISLAAPTVKHPSILIAAQHRNSQQTSKIGNIEAWINQQVIKLKEITDRPIIIRPHPRSPLNLSQLLPGIEVKSPNPVVGTYDSFDMKFDHHAIVNHNSGVGIQAALAGVRPIVDSTSLAHPVSVELNKLEQLYLQDRKQWLIEICHTEYTVQELKEGLWLKRIGHHLQ